MKSTLRPFTRPLLLIASVAILSGCSTSGIIAGDAAGSESPYILAYDKSFNRQVSVIEAGHDTVGDLMRGRVTMQSNRNRSLMIIYKFAWFDASGLEIDPDTKPYRSMVIEGHDTEVVSSVAPNPNAVEFKLKVRKVKYFKFDNIR